MLPILPQIDTTSVLHSGLVQEDARNSIGDPEGGEVMEVAPRE